MSTIFELSQFNPAEGLRELEPNPTDALQGGLTFNRPSAAEACPHWQNVIFINISS